MTLDLSIKNSLNTFINITTPPITSEYLHAMSRYSSLNNIFIINNAPENITKNANVEISPFKSKTRLKTRYTVNARANIEQIIKIVSKMAGKSNSVIDDIKYDIIAHIRKNTDIFNDLLFCKNSSMFIYPFVN